MKLLTEGPRRHGRVCLGYQVAAGKVVLELALWSKKIYLRTGGRRESERKSAK